MEFCPKCGKDNWDTSGIRCLNCDYQKGVFMKKTNNVQYPDVGVICVCGYCGRKILVERLLCGTNHTIFTSACCWDCAAEKDKEQAVKRYGIKEE